MPSLRPGLRARRTAHHGRQLTMDLHLHGKKVLITGATKGIGRAIAESFVAEEAHVAICARNGELVQSTVDELKAKGATAYGASVDVADTAALKAWIDDSAARLGGIDIYVSNVS